MGRGHLNLKSLGGLLFALCALIWVFHDVKLSAIASMAGSIAGWWLVPAVVCDVLSYICQGVRWQLLVQPLGNLTLRRAAQAIYAGLFTNEVVPLRFGEVVRAYLAARAIGQPLTSLIPSIAVERLIDSFWLAVGCGVMLLFVPLPPEFTRAAEVFGVLIAGLSGVFVLLVLKPPRFIHRWSKSRNGPLRPAIGGLLSGIGDVGLNRRLAGAVAYSLALLLLQAAAFWLVMIACRLPLGYGSAAAVFLIVHLGTALPNAPANVGAFQFFTVLGLQLFGVDKATAASFSVVVFVVLTLPLWILGFAAISTAGVTLAEIRSRTWQPQVADTAVAVEASRADGGSRPVTF